MTDRQTIEIRLRQKEKEMQNLEARLRESRGYVRALRELLGLSPYGEKSMAKQARDIISERGHPVHIIEMLHAMGREVTRESRVSLTSALSAYVRRGDTFTKAGPNQFGLLEHRSHKKSTIRTKPLPRSEPPDNFGEIEVNREKTDKIGNDT